MKLLLFLLLLFPSFLFAQGKLEVLQDNENSANANPPKIIKVETANGILFYENPDYKINDDELNERSNTNVLPNSTLKNEDSYSPEIKSESNFIF